MDENERKRFEGMHFFGAIRGNFEPISTLIEDRNLFEEIDKDKVTKSETPTPIISPMQTREQPGFILIDAETGKNRDEDNKNDHRDGQDSVSNKKVANVPKDGSIWEIDGSTEENSTRMPTPPKAARFLND